MASPSDGAVPPTMKPIFLGNRIPYPINVYKLWKAEGDSIKKQERLLEYTYTLEDPAIVDPASDPAGDDGRPKTRQTSRVASWHSPVEGILKMWHVHEGQTIDGDRAAIGLEEVCGHGLQYSGLCAFCGDDMTWKGWESEQADTNRATINMLHDQTNLMISNALAERAERDSQRRLLEQRKLSLVVDLDQTIIHACIDPTVREWKDDPSSPNHEVVRDVAVFQLDDDVPRGTANGFSYYIKVRPGCREFLETVSKQYELHVYTMATRAYALNIARIVDPDRKFFGNRVISRDENGTITSKNLQRLFPVSTNLVVIIDDRSDMWPRNRKNLIKVVPFDFFKGIGDINSSFLPKRRDILAPPAPRTNGAPDRLGNGTRAPKTAPTASDGDAKMSALEELVTMSGADDKELQERQVQEQEQFLQKQIAERPLQHLQEELEKQAAETDSPDSASASASASAASAAAAAAVAAQSNGDGSHAGSRQPEHHQQQQPRHILDENDKELVHLQKHLSRLHASYFREFDDAVGSREMFDCKTMDVSHAPDVGLVLSGLKRQVLSGVAVVLSGLVRIGEDVSQSEIGMQVTSFGAQLHKAVSPSVTHLVLSSARPYTHKAWQAAKIPKVKIVNQNWLSDCFSQWRHLDETPYLVNLPSVGHTGDTTPYGDTSGDDDEADDEEKFARELRGLMPEEIPEGGKSPIDDLKSFDWGSVDEELAEFLSSDDEVNDEDEDEDDDDEEEDEDDDEEEEGDDNNNNDDDDDEDDDDDDDGDDGDDVGETDRHDPAGDIESSRDESRPGQGHAGTKRKASDDDDDTESGTGSPGGSLNKKSRMADGTAMMAVMTEAPADTEGEDDGFAELEADLIAELEAADGDPWSE